MKKLMIAMAIAGAVGFAQAGLNTTNADFELANLGMFNIGSGEGTEWAAAAEDMDGGSVTTAIVTNDTPAAEVGGSQYLKLDGVTDLARNANADEYGQPYEIAENGAVYIDTLVKFTITEDEAPVPGDGDKLCIWVKENNGTTNLMVTAGYIDENGTASNVNYVTTYAFSGDLNTTWYRLIVTAIRGIDEAGALQGFMVSVGEAGSTLTKVLSTEDTYGYEAADPLASGLNELEIFPSLISWQDNPDAFAQITSIAFKGTGAIDNLQFTTVNPAPEPEIPNYTVTISGGVNATVAATTNDITFASGGTVPSNTVVKVVATPGSTYEYTSAVEASGWTIDSGDGSISQEFTVDSDNFSITVPDATEKSTPPTPGEDWVDPEDPVEMAKIVDKPVSEVYASVATAVPELANADAGLLTQWATGTGNVSFNDASTINVECYLLNIANDSNAATIKAAEAVAEDAIKITAITFDENGDPVISSAATYGNGVVVVEGSIGISPASWHDKTDGDYFFRTVLRIKEGTATPSENP